MRVGSTVLGAPPRLAQGRRTERARPGAAVVLGGRFGAPVGRRECHARELCARFMGVDDARRHVPEAEI